MGYKVACGSTAIYSVVQIVLELLLMTRRLCCAGPIVRLSRTPSLRMHPRFPTAWAERAEEARRKEARLRELLAAQRARQQARDCFLPVI